MKITTSKNCVIVFAKDARILFSYDVAIVMVENSGKITLDSKYWDYGQTTGKHRNNFLGESKKETVDKIKTGVYSLGNLN